MHHDDERHLVAAFRARTVPDDETKAALLERLLADTPRAVAGPWRRVGLAAGLALAIAAAALLFIRGAVALLTPASAPETDEAVYGTSASPASRTAPATTTLRPVVTPSPAPTQPGTVPPSPSPTPAPTPDVPSPPDDALTQEAKLLGRAQAAMRDGDATRALAVLDEHARRFPAGTMQLERDALKVIVGCELDPSHAASARTVLADPRAASYASRIRRACKL